MAVRKIDLMHRFFGKDEAHTCGECNNLCSYRYRGKTYRKCEIYGVTNSEASDWAKRWTACGSGLATPASAAPFCWRTPI